VFTTEYVAGIPEMKNCSVMPGKKCIYISYIQPQHSARSQLNEYVGMICQNRTTFMFLNPSYERLALIPDGKLPTNQKIEG